MKAFVVILLFFLNLILNLGCGKIKYYPDVAIVFDSTRILAHRAGGGGDSPYQENCLEAARYGFSSVDGIECDIQISKDRTIWLSHSSELPECTSIPAGCFPETTDGQIVQLDSCMNDEAFSRLEEILAYMAAHHPQKHISLDVKAWTPCSVNSLEVTGVMNVIADKIQSLADKYKLHRQILVESETATFLQHLSQYKNHPDCYLSANGDFERALQLTLKGGFQGISFKYQFKEDISEGNVALLHRKGLRIQLWTVDEVDAIKEALSIKPDYIQTDNLAYFK
ncbi:MAG TPA: glycerophosphodiester phosphodiesterase [Catalimonadaceae bacterium]|nr:glycerophosphodiester phosphodiesterase [Catalimonadaceae bacterium]